MGNCFGNLKPNIPGASADDIQKMVEENITKPLNEAQSTFKTTEEAVKKLKSGEEYTLPNTQIKIPAGATTADLKGAAAEAAFNDEERGNIKNKVWETVKEKIITPASPNFDTMPDFLKTSVKKTNDVAVDAAINKAIESFKQGGSTDQAATAGGQFCFTIFFLFFFYYIHVIFVF
eukprot:GHVR01186583.1.p1 GENE.GHVR01186583.1~~GHVR01186583.1.p1  ORF type:complete len:176 (-),score=36.17 GHVR01186583.1:270-797(-)